MREFEASFIARRKIYHEKFSQNSNLKLTPLSSTPCAGASQAKFDFSPQVHIGFSPSKFFQISMKNILEEEKSQILLFQEEKNESDQWIPNSSLRKKNRPDQG